MSTYFVSFRVAEINTPEGTQAERRRSISDNAAAFGGGYWDETTSFIIFDCELDTPGAGAAVVRGLSRAHDLAVVFDPSDMSLFRFGAFKYGEALDSFFGHTDVAR